MAETPYTFSISTDFPSGVVNYTQLRQEIEASSISSAVFLYHTSDADELNLVFDGELSSGDEDTLNALVAAHDPAETTQSAQTAASLGEENTTSTDWVEKLSATIPPMKNGDYLFAFYAEIKTDGQGVAARVTYNGNEQAFTSWGESQYHAFSGTVVASIKEGANPTVAIEYRVLGTGPAYIRRARLAVTLLDKEG